jgi:hypothetical protein
MGAEASIPIKEPQHFGNIHPEPGQRARPGYYVKGNIVVYQGQTLPLVPGEQDIQKLKYGYLKTNKRVFFKGQVLPSANPLTFTVLTRNNTNTISKFPEKNQSFKRMNCVMATDFQGNTKRVYCGANIIHTE